jgi:hypothetical protein
MSSHNKEKALDSRSLDFGNDPVRDDASLQSCEHGQPWESCEDEDSREIGRLDRERVQEEDRERDARVYAQKYGKRRPEGKSQYEIALEQPRVLKREDYEIKLPEEEEEEESQSAPPAPRKLFCNIFPDEITLRAALQFKALTTFQANLLRAYVDFDNELPTYKIWKTIGEKIGCSGKTVEREFLYLTGKFLATNNATGQRTATISIVHVRGERRPRYYRRHSIQIGEWKRDWSELITDKKLIREIRRQRAAIVESEKIPIPSSPVNRLFAALIRHFASDLPGGNVRPYDANVHDWEYNLRMAERLLRQKSTGLWTALEVYRTLGRGAHLCQACRTFLIRGFRIHGRRITKAREFCDDACKMRAERRKKIDHGS